MPRTTSRRVVAQRCSSRPVSCSASAGGSTNWCIRFTSTTHFVGSGYGTPTPASDEAAALAAATEGLVLDPVYTAKAMAALIAYVRKAASPSVRRCCSGTPAAFLDFSHDPDRSLVYIQRRSSPLELHV